MPLMGIEPMLFCLQDRCFTTKPKRQRNTPSRGRTYDLLLRRETRYPLRYGGRAIAQLII